MRILLVEDEPALAATTAARLKSEGFVVDQFGTLGDAIEAVMTTQYRAVLLDRRLPDGDGLALLPVLRTRPSPPPVIVLTALDEIPDRVAGLDAGAEDYLINVCVCRAIGTASGPVSSRWHAIVRAWSQRDDRQSGVRPQRARSHR